MLAGASIVMAAVPAYAMAQAASDSSGLETVVVTARKRTEDLSKVPVAITALTSSDLQTKDISSFQDIANFTPSLEDDTAPPEGFRADRSFQTLIIRGMLPSEITNPTTSIFINGVSVPSDLMQNLDDAGQVEVLKGPQSAYFGRETFAGAVNVSPTLPSLTHFGGIFNGEVGTRESQRVNGSVDVPIVQDILGLRVGGYYDSHDGSYKNVYAPYKTLGDQETQSFHASLLAKPIENLTIKAYGIYLQDNDGPAATGVILARTGVNGQANCTVAGTPYVCGTIPNLNTALFPAQNLTITPAVANWFNNTGLGGVINPKDSVHNFGLKRVAYHADWTAEYTVPQIGVTMTYLGGFARDGYDEASDLFNGVANGVGFPFVIEQAQKAWSQEFRIATDPKAPIRGLVGVSYAQTNVQSGGGYIGALAAEEVSPQNPTESDTTGFFFSLGWDIIKNLTLTFDGRYQSDKEKALTLANVVQFQATSNDFLPRVSLQYNVTPTNMVYATYSEGVNPGTFNAGLNVLPAVSQAELAKNGAGSTVVQPEHLTNYEIGYKGHLFDNRLSVALDAYYDTWTNQLTPKTYVFAANDPANQYNVVGYAGYVPGNTSAATYNYVDNSSSSLAKGVEGQIDAKILKNWTLNLAGAITDTQYTALACLPSTCVPESTTISAKGKYLPDVPLYSLNIGLQYDGQLPLPEQVGWYIRGDYIYRAGIYIDPSNITKTPDINTINARAGIIWKNLNVEAYVINLTNDASPTASNASLNFSNGAYDMILTSLPQLITGGVRVRYRF
jgi:iron complex outermembrane receptor protein